MAAATPSYTLLCFHCAGDHGPFNSWDRDPYIFDLPDGTTSTVKMFEEFRNNFIIANYNSLGALDNDDGSAYYWVRLRAQ